MSKYTKRAEEALQNRAEGISEREFFGAELCRLEREANREITELFIITAEEGREASVTRMGLPEFFNMVRGFDKSKLGTDIAEVCRVFTSRSAAEAAAEKHNALSLVLMQLRGLDTEQLRHLLGTVQQQRLNEAESPRGSEIAGRLLLSQMLERPRAEASRRSEHQNLKNPLRVLPRETNS